jgi:hypothetical protein
MKPVKQAIVGGALVAGLAAGAFGAAFLTGTAGAQTSTTAPAGQGTVDPAKGGHAANGITETVLTGDAAAKATAAALAAVPGGTVQRVENDAEGAVYEAHMLKADGTGVTVKMDANFVVTDTEAGGPGGGGPGAHQPRPAS